MGNTVRRFGFVVVAVVGVMFAGAGMTGSGAAVSTPLPVVTVSPSTGLVDLQKVTLTGSGFTANAQVASAQCRPGAIGESDCDLSTVVYGQADQNVPSRKLVTSDDCSRSAPTLSIAPQRRAAHWAPATSQI